MKRFEYITVKAWAFGCELMDELNKAIQPHQVIISITEEHYPASQNRYHVLVDNNPPCPQPNAPSPT